MPTSSQSPTPPSTPDPVARFKAAYLDLSLETLDRLRDLYAPDIDFIDPIHETRGLEDLLGYCRKMYDGVASCRFTYEETLAGPDSAVIVWTMHMRHRTFRPSETLHLPGTSHIRFADGRITYHRDYYDAGAMIYERVPLLGAVVRAVKRRLGA